MNWAISFLKTNWNRLSLENQDPDSELSWVMLTPRFRASRNVVILVSAGKNGKPLVVVKAPRLPDNQANLRDEADNLHAVQMAKLGGFNSIPRLIACEEWHGHPLLVETSLIGTPMGPMQVRNDSQKCISGVLDWLIDLNTTTSQPVAHDGQWFERLVSKPLDRMHALPLSVQEEFLLRKTKEMASSLRDCKFPLVFEHGDLSDPNILMQGELGVGVVDWELGQPAGLPALDLFFFLTYVAFARSNARSPRGYLAAFHEAFFAPSWATPHVRRYVDGVGVAADALRALFVFCWARSVARLADRLTSGRPESLLSDGESLAWLRENRYYLLWQHSVEHASSLSWEL